MKTQLELSIETLKICFVKPNILDMRKLNDSLRFSIAMAVVDREVKSGNITYKEFYSQLKGTKK